MSMPAFIHGFISVQHKMCNMPVLGWVRHGIECSPKKLPDTLLCSLCEEHHNETQINQSPVIATEREDISLVQIEGGKGKYILLIH